MRASSAAAYPALLVLASCSGDTPQPTGPDPDPAPTPVATTLTVTPDSLILGVEGDTARFTAVVRDQNNAPMSGVQVVWVSSDTSIAKVDAAGRVQSSKAGRALISATAGQLRKDVAAVVKVQLNSACQVPTTFPSTPSPRGVPTLVADHAAMAVAGQPYNSTETAAADFDGDGDQDLVLFNYNWIDQSPYTGTVLVYRNAGNGTFEDATQAVLGGADIVSDNGTRPIVFDANGDSRDDVFIGQGGFDADPFPGAHNLLLLSQPDGTLKEVAASNLRTNAKSFTHSSTAADIDCDGDVDLYEGNINDFKGDKVHLHVNNGSGIFTAEDSRLPSSVADVTHRYTASAFCDVDRDGDPDLALGGWQNGRSENRLLINNGFGRFAFAAGTPFPDPHFSTSNVTVELRCVDLDVDGWPDLLVSSTSEYSDGHVAIWINQQNRTFSDATSTYLNESWGGQWIMLTHAADLNDDGLPDLILSGTIEATQRVFINQGQTAMARASLPNDLYLRRLVPVRHRSTGAADIVAIPWGSGSTPILIRTH